MERKVCSILNELTVEDFLEIYSERIQNRMSELGYYVKDGLFALITNKLNNDLEEEA